VSNASARATASPVVVRCSKSALTILEQQDVSGLARSRSRSRSRGPIRERERERERERAERRAELFEDRGRSFSPEISAVEDIQLTIEDLEWET
jgi:hypothetical protein